MINLSDGQLLGLTVVLTCAWTDGRSMMLLLPVAAAPMAISAAAGLHEHDPETDA